MLETVIETERLTTSNASNAINEPAASINAPATIFKPSSAWLDRSKFTNAGSVFPYSVSILSWGLNEEESIEEFLLRAKAMMDSFQVEYEHIFIDDGSTDGTFAIASRVQKIYPQLKIIKNERNRGSGWNTRIAVAAATKDVLFWQTVDWCYDIKNIGRYLWSLRDHDVVQGVRVEPNKPRYGWLFEKIPLLRDIRVTKRSDNFQKAVISLTNYLLVRILFQVPLLDFQNVTIYPRKLAQSIQFESASAFSNPEMLLKAYWKGARIGQVSIGFIARDKGVAKGTRLKVVLKSVSQVLGFWFKWVIRGKRPDKLVGSIDPEVIF